MGNCLVTKLKGVVDNDNLKKVGCIKLHVIVGANASINRLGESTSPYCSVEIIGEGHFSSTQGGSDNIGTKRVSSTTLYPSAGEYDIEISNKYALVNLTMSSITVVSMDAADFDYTNLRSFALFKTRKGVSFDELPDAIFNSGFKILNFDDGQNYAALDVTKLANNTIMTYFKYSSDSAASASLYGDISGLGGKPSMTFLGIKNQLGITGDISSLGGNVALTRIECYKSGVGGAIEDLAAAQVAAGRTSGSLAVFYSAPVTYNDESPLDSATKTITFNDSLTNGYSIA